MKLECQFPINQALILNGLRRLRTLAFSPLNNIKLDW
jgi:hypothetical protein